MSRTDSLVARGYTPLQIALYYGMRKILRELREGSPMNDKGYEITKSHSGNFFACWHSGNQEFAAFTEYKTLLYLLDHDLTLGVKVNFEPHPKPITPLVYFHHALMDVKDILRDMPSDGTCTYTSKEYGTWKVTRIACTDQFRLEYASHPQDNTFDGDADDIARLLIKRDMFPHFDERLWFVSAANLSSYATSAGSHFFDKDSMSFFDSEIHPSIFSGVYFITSEQFHTWDKGKRISYPRHYTIRCIDSGASITEVIPFDSFDTLNEAIEVITLLTSQN